MLRRTALGVIALGVLAASSAWAAPPALQARAWYAVSAYDGAVLAERDAASRRPVASITKLMTVLVALEHARLDELVTVRATAAGIGESTIFLQPGDRVSVHDLAIGALVPSANDAATALALHVGHGSIPRFVALMNAKARALGLGDSHFTNPHGLDEPGHVSSARDAVLLARAALQVPFIRRAVGLERAVLRGREFTTTDDLLARWGPLLGGKTGHTARAGWSQVAAARRGGVTVYAAVLGSPSRAQRNADLETVLRWALAEYRPIAATTRGRTYARVRTAYGRPDVRLVAVRAIVRPARVGRPLRERIVAPTHVALPVLRGQRLGEVRIYDGRRLVAATHLVAAEPVSEPDRLGKLRWYATRTVHHLVGLVS